jgi:hypothetical protein
MTMSDPVLATHVANMTDGGSKPPRFTGELHMTESVILPSGLHRVKFRQVGQVPDVEAIKERCKLNDGQYAFFTAWMDDEGKTGYAVLAWKEYQQLKMEVEA